jgi:uncharacterized membrane protein
MADHEKADGTGILSTSIDRLRHELTDFAAAQAQRMVTAAGRRVTDMTGRLGDTAQGAASLPKIGMKLGAKTVTDKVKKTVGGIGGGGDGGPGNGGGANGGIKATNIMETVDIGLPLRDCYNHWTQFEKFSSFMNGVQGVDRSDETETDWKVKVGPSSRSWHATVQKQVPDERIEWTSEGAKATTRGVVTFHELAPRLTRIVVVVEYFPSGFFEKTGNLWRAQGRRLRLDLKHFQRYVTIEAEEVPEGWRGEIRDGDVVRSHEDALAEEGGEEEEEEADEDEVDEDEDEEGEEEEEEEEEEDERGGRGDR